MSRWYQMIVDSEVHGMAEQVMTDSVDEPDGADIIAKPSYLRTRRLETHMT